ncbi:hypothetical protein MX572_23245 (plasmid) [Rhodococcus pyridinivorans]|uniref:hypothetical protein n=1 Tax=Rhodococcus pyridinivorans TaxID=103816 RepID=UPI0020C5D9BF|nr:hypothetical protein [Rhodococcus pyridinivorans]UTM39775.1 hypothetical protein MX572_23245 [Rhodococcus pyridinivorans]
MSLDHGAGHRSPDGTGPTAAALTGAFLDQHRGVLAHRGLGAALVVETCAHTLGAHLSAHTDSTLRHWCSVSAAECSRETALYITAHRHAAVCAALVASAQHWAHGHLEPSWVLLDHALGAAVHLLHVAAAPDSVVPFDFQDTAAASRCRWRQVRTRWDEEPPPCRDGIDDFVVHEATELETVGAVIDAAVDVCRYSPDDIAEVDDATTWLLCALTVLLDSSFALCDLYADHSDDRWIEYSRDAIACIATGLHRYFPR